jgi:HK97 family phage major capsid protein
MAFYTSGGSSILTPEQVGRLVVEPIYEQSTALQTSVATPVTTSSHSYRIPKLTADATASWVAEGAEITPSDPTVSELTVTPSKVAGLTVLSSELAADSSNPAAANLIGNSLVNDVANQIDAAFFGNTTTNGPSGLGSITPTAVDAGAAYDSLDAFAEAISQLQQKGSKPTAFLVNPALALVLAQLKTDSTISLKPLLQPDPTQPGKQLVFGVPLVVNRHVPNDVVWAVDAARIVVVVREDTTVETSREAFFTSDRIAVRTTCRIGFGFPYEAGLVKISLSS